ncbi:MAG TPA: translation initiation factor IF-2 [Candidatus Ornithoclostridium faecigallinarum]|nr:translation initiation factor IF-2 [Candidatus Ornithoclostridium faecigallinarum]
MEGESRQNFKKNILEIPTVLGTKVRPLLSAITAKKKEISEATEKIGNIINEIYDKLEAEAQKERAELLAAEKAAAQSAKEADKKDESDAEAKSAESVETVSDSDAQASAPVESGEKAAQAVESKDGESKPADKSDRQNQKPAKSENREKPAAQDKPKQSTVYINPDLLGGQQRPQRQGDRRPPRPDRQDGRPPLQRPQGGRPTPGMRAEQVQAPVNPAYNKDKKKAKPQTSRDESKKGLSKRDLFKKGYVYDATREDEDAGGYRHVKARRGKKDTGAQPTIVIEHAVINTDPVAIKVLAEKIGKPAAEIVKKLFDMGEMATINGSVSFETAEFVALDYGITLELKLDTTAEDKLREIAEMGNEVEAVRRPPIVTVMGHVDHGKTSLLDSIRQTNVVRGEAGGITQHIGAYSVDINGSKITFLDTPGHEAFTAMRRRGAMITDIAVIVVAADDGIMPQTIEAIHHAKEAGVAIIIAANKIDKPHADIEKVKQQLAAQDVLVEEWGGDVMLCPVSAKTGEGVKELLESILLLAEVLDLKAPVDCPAVGSVVEARLDKGLGPVATVIVQRGTVHVADYAVAGTAIGKIRSMTDWMGKRIKEAGPSLAVQIQGFAEVPMAGDKFVVVKDEKLAKDVAAEREAKERLEMQNRVASAKTLDDMFKNAEEGAVKSLAVIIKADVQGSAEAVKQSLLEISEKMKDENVRITVIHSGVGAINEGDVNLAYTAKAIIVGFNVKPEPKAKALADRSAVEIRSYRVIYDAIDDFTKALKGMLEPVYKEEELGHAEVRQTFRISGVGLIAGSYILDGKVSRGCKARLVRDNIIVYEGSVSSLKREKNDAKEVAAGYECGIGLENCNDIKVGDIIETFELVQVNKE